MLAFAPTSILEERPSYITVSYTHLIKEHFSNHKLVGSLLTILAVVIACGILFFGSYRMDWTPKEASTDAQVIEAHERLLALGYPESELNDLSDEDLLTCLRAERVVIKECTGSAYINYSNKPQTNDAFHLTIVCLLYTSRCV